MPRETSVQQTETSPMNSSANELFLYNGYIGLNPP